MMFDESERAELMTVFRDETDQLVANIDADLLRLEELAKNDASDPEVVNSLFRALHTIKGSAGMLQLQEVSGLAHQLENACDFLRSGKIALSKGLVDVLFNGRDLLTALIRFGVEGGVAPPPGLIQEIQARLDPLLRRAPVEASPGPVAAVAVDSVPAPAPARGRTIRVEIAKLDVLLDLVGELVIAKNRIAQIASSLDDRDLEVAAAQLSRTAADLQEAVMRARMVRVAGVFERFPRLVRDLARSQGKDVQLLIEGADTSLDKTIVDEIGEPLLHLVRNCIDHGIESPRRRRECGKPQIGTLRMRAYQEGNTVFIEVSDDGGGIDLDRVRERGRELGLIPPDKEHSERSLLELLFVSGFSTAKSVTEISGRGIGMDVVRRTVTALSGTLEIATHKGQGTTFTIRMPLTLAIIPAMLVRIAEALYALPVDNVTESLRLDAAEIQRDRTGEFVAYRGRTLPVIRGAEFFEVGSVAGHDPKVLIAVLSAAGREVGLIVDRLVGEQEIVVKAIPDLGGIPGIAGGTVLGDGSIALIVDCISLLNHASRAEGSIVVSGSSR